MSRESVIGIGLTLLIALLQWRIKDMPHAVTAGGIVFAVGLIGWPYIPLDSKYNFPLFLGLVSLALMAAAITWGMSISPDKKDVSVVSEPIPEPLYAAQLGELREIDAFLGRKDEMGLRETFDFPRMFKFDVRMAQNQLIPGSVSPDKLRAIDVFFAGGKGQIDARFAKVSRTEADGIHYEAIPGRIGLLNLSKTYAASLSKLDEFIASATTPSDVKDALTEFRAAIVDDTTLMFDVINERFSENAQFLQHDDDYGSPLYGAVTNNYAQRFVQLRPKADKVTAAIRRYLKVN